MLVSNDYNHDHSPQNCVDYSHGNQHGVIFKFPYNGRPGSITLKKLHYPLPITFLRKCNALLFHYIFEKGPLPITHYISKIPLLFHYFTITSPIEKWHKIMLSVSINYESKSADTPEKSKLRDFFIN